MDKPVVSDPHAAVPPPLEYAPPTPGRNVRRRLLTLLALGAAVIGAVWLFNNADPYWRQASMLYTQRQVRLYAAPDDQVVYETDPSRVPQPAKAPGLHPAALGQPTTRYVRDLPECYQAYRRLLSSRFATGAPLYVGERTTHAGQRYIVVLYFDATYTFGPAGCNDDFPFVAVMVREADWQTWPIAVSNAYAIYRDDELRFRHVQPRIYSSSSPLAPNVSLASAFDVTRYYAGQSDPSDASHFTVGFDVQGRHGAFNVYVRDSDSDLDSPFLKIEAP